MLAKQIRIPDWVGNVRLSRLFEVMGADADMYFVGGCVRDTLLERPIGDIDLATSLQPEETRKRLEDAGIKVFVWGIGHGTVTAYLDDTHFEITSFREDVVTDGRHAKVSFTKDMKSDAQRRDFTVNALYLDKEGQLYDPTGQGLKDIEGQNLHFIGRAEERLREDYLRAYRYFRFCAELEWDITPDYLPLFYAVREHYTLISSERKIHELTKIFACKNPAEILRQMAEVGLITLYDDAQECGRLRRFFQYQIRYNAYSFYSRFFACFMGCGSDVSGLYDTLSSATRTDIKTLQKTVLFLGQNSSCQPAELLYRFGRDAALQACLWMQKNDDYIEDICHADIPAFPLTGADVMRAGMKEGPEIGAGIKKAEEAWIASGFQLSLEELVKTACRG
ncbi:MAG: CCA tRNA nucleotidyltransferase [Pseudobdellovibrionaceae bacterium]